MDPLIDTVFAGRYRLERALGVGGMATVYLARHEVLNRPLALKVIHSRLMSDQVIEGFFRREARAASRIDHAHVTYIFDFGHGEGGRPYLAMEYAPGPTLAQVILSGGRIPSERALPILIQIAEGVAAAHACDVVHRDLKPGNVVLTKHRGREDFVKVLDFGLAKLGGIDATIDPCLDSKEFGTPQYMSPEQCSGNAVDFRADVYSFGVMAYEMLTGKLPFEGPIAKILWMHVHQPPPRVADEASLPAELDTLIYRCMAKHPAERFTDGTALVAELDGIHSLLHRRRTLRMSQLEGRTLPPGDLGVTVRADDVSATVGSSAGATRRRWSAVDELAYSLRDRGIGSPLITDTLAKKLEVEDQLLEIESEIDRLQGETMHVEMRARERETRLRKALVQVEHEQARLDDRPAARASEKAPFEETLKFGSGDLNAARFDKRKIALAERIGQILFRMEKRVAEVQRRISLHEREIRDLQGALDERREQLVAFLIPLKECDEVKADRELLAQYLVAGLIGR